MEYTINKLSKITGVTSRTLRYYDEINLLKPVRINSSGYRIYGSHEVDLLQQILFYRELGVSLETIKDIVTSPSFEMEEALKSHLTALENKRTQIETLISNVKSTLKAMKGETTMTDNEKFEGFKRELIENNEKQYGEEIRKKYGDKRIDSSNAKLRGMTEEQYKEVEQLSNEINEKLLEAFNTGDPAGEVAQQLCMLHKKWISFYWESYSKEAHVGVAEMYVADPRFTAYYDGIVEGGSVFLRDAIKIFCK